MGSRRSSVSNQMCIKLHLHMVPDLVPFGVQNYFWFFFFHFWFNGIVKHSWLWLRIACRYSTHVLWLSYPKFGHSDTAVTISDYRRKCMRAYRRCEIVFTNTWICGWIAGIEIIKWVVIWEIKILFLPSMKLKQQSIFFKVKLYTTFFDRDETNQQTYLPAFLRCEIKFVKPVN